MGSDIRIDIVNFEIKYKVSATSLGSINVSYNWFEANVISPIFVFVELGERLQTRILYFFNSSFIDLE